MHMDPQNLKKIIIDQQDIDIPEHFIERQIYKKIERLKSSDQVLILSGLRRCGKSVILQQLRKESAESHYWINFDDDRLVSFQVEDFQLLYELFIELFGVQKTFYFDEIQNINGWERFVRRLHDQKNKIYITGSNASMLSRELGTRLTGRHIAINLYPYSFEEYLAYHQQTKLIKKSLTTIEKSLLKAAFNDFLKMGGLPEYLHSKSNEYLHSLYENILYRDIIVRHNIKNTQAIREFVNYLASNVSKPCSFNAIRKMIGIASTTTISEYSRYLEDSFLCFFINRFDYSIKKQTQSPKKVYFIDQALATRVGFHFSKESGRLLENIVFLELKRRGHDIYYHQGTHECDFVLREGLKIANAIQVTLSLDNPDTRKREIAGLLDAMTTYQLEHGLILTMDTDTEETVTQNGATYNVIIKPIWRWLLNL